MNIPQNPAKPKSLRVDRVNDGDVRPVRLPEGNYAATLLRWNVELKFGRPTLIMVFRIEDMGTYYHVELLRYFEVEATRTYRRKGKPPRINFKCSWRRDWAKQYEHLFGEQKKNTDDYLNPDALAHRVWEITLRDKTKDSKGKMPEKHWESRVHAILRMEA